MALVYLGLGANLGDKARQLHRAIALIGLSLGDVLNVSSFYQSSPHGFDSPHDFLNAAMVLSTSLTPLDVLSGVEKIERKMGRTHKSTHAHYADRPIDIDVLFFDNQQIHLPTLTVPHPQLHTRDFVLAPLAEIAPDFVHPVLGKTMRALLESIENKTVIWNDCSH